MAGRAHQRKSIRRTIKYLVYANQRGPGGHLRNLKRFGADDRIQVNERDAALTQSLNLLDESVAVASSNVLAVCRARRYALKLRP
jgi:hypothetical protein